jgi:thioesterase domain-containing protein/acyl carrier protein
MVPAQLLFVDELPLTPNGKVDRKALAAADRAPAAARHVAPRTVTELALAQIFEQLLGVRPVGARDDFFLLGGHSLLSIQLVAAIQARLGVALPVATLFGARTVEALAQAVDERGAANPSNLVVLRREGDGIPVVLVHPIGGTVFCYLDLVARLAPGRPCYAIQARRAAAPPVESVDAMARDHVELVARQLGRGPCHLFGWSFGGVVALEMARLLAVTGHDVVSTTLLDSYVASSMQAPELDSHDVLVWFARDLGVDLAKDELAGLDREQALAHLVARLARAAILPGHVGVAELARHLRVFGANLAAERRHRARPVHGNVTLITASESEPQVDPCHGFRAAVTGGLELRSMAGDHYSLLRPPQVDELARLLDQILSGSEARHVATRVAP